MSTPKFISDAGSNDLRGLITNIYISIMLLLFPLFVGFSGYSRLTFSKYLFFVIATALWMAAIMLISIIRREKWGKLLPHHWAALLFMAIVCISALISPYRSESILGASRYDGLITQLLYACIFIGVSRFAKPEKFHFFAFGISVAICCLVAVFQLFNINIFSLFPGDYSHYDKGIRYSSAFLGTIGNTNVLSEFLCLAIPVFFALPVVSGKKMSLLALIPLSLSVFVMLRSEVSGGIVALGCCGLIGAPIVLTNMARVRRGLAMLAFCLIPVILAMAFMPEFADRQFSFSFAFGRLSLTLLVLAAALLAAAAIFRFRNVQASEETLRVIFAGISAAAVVFGLIFIYFTPTNEGTIYELSRVLHGEVDDSFGSSRILIWKECLEAWKDAPLLGSGPDTLALRIDIDFSRYVEETGKTLSTSVDNAHNSYLGYLVNTGLFGLLAYTAMLAFAFAAWLKNIHRPYICTLGLALLCFCAQSFFALGLCLVTPVFWIITALTLGGCND